MIKLTKRSVDAILPSGTDHFIWDNILSGFGVRVSPKGQKTYIIQYRYRGRTQRVKLGRTNRITADIARRDAKIIVGEVEAGKNPAQSIGQYRKSPTLNKISERFIEEHVNVRLKSGTQDNYKRVLKSYILPVLGTRKLIDIQHKDIVKLHLDLQHIPCQANRSVLVLSKLFNLCEQWELREQGKNPCRHIQFYKENKRNRFLDKIELQRLWQALDAASNEGIASLYAVNAYKLLILTGCRLSEIRTMQWSFIRGNHVEFPDTKTGYKRLPLNEEAMHILRQTPRLPDNEYVICGDKLGRPIINLQKSWRRVRAIANLDDVRIHDLRHTFASHAVMGGTPLALVSRLLGHSKISTTMRYAHLADAELAKASEGIGAMVGSNLAQLKDNNASHLKVVK